MKVVVAAFNQEKALVGAFSVITNLRIELFQALMGAFPSKMTTPAAGITDPDRHHTASVGVGLNVVVDNSS